MTELGIVASLVMVAAALTGWQVSRWRAEQARADQQRRDAP